MTTVLCLVHFAVLFLQKAESFTWGTATAAYQVEGFREADGREPSIWDAFDTPNISRVVHSTKPSGALNVFGGQSGAQADEDYVQFANTVSLTQTLGFGAVRLSISWPRVMRFAEHPQSGKLMWGQNEEGIAHYHTVLQKYRAAGVKVALTMFHWDLPLSIEEYASKLECKSAWLCHDLIAELFSHYVRLLLREYKDLVHWWITLNEPLTVVTCGYANGGPHAPGRCSNRTLCHAGDDRAEPYLAAKGLLLAHAHGFREWEAAGRPGAGCGLSLNGDWRMPNDPMSKHDQQATLRSLEWQAPLFADPIHFGRWPRLVQEAVRERLPQWTAEELKLVNGSHDGNFFMNSYTSLFVRAITETRKCGWSCDKSLQEAGYNFTTGQAIGTASSNGWLYRYGPGLGDLVSWYNERYPGLSYVITENGWGNASAFTQVEDVLDYERCNFYRDYIGNLSAVVARNKINVSAYFAWSIMDNYEWADGYSTRFGLTFVDYATQRRTPKLSAAWFRAYITKLTELPTDGKPLPECDVKLLLGDGTGHLWHIEGDDAAAAARADVREGRVVSQLAPQNTGVVSSADDSGPIYMQKNSVQPTDMIFP